MKYQYGHWLCEIEVPNDAVGFIYQITNKATGKKYIGRKNLMSTRRKQVNCKTKAGKKTQIVKKESNWMSYTGSCTQLNNDIVLLGKDQFTFIILSFHTSKSALNYAEVEQIIKQDALIKYFKDGSPAFYNGLCPPVRTRPTINSKSN